MNLSLEFLLAKLPFKTLSDVKTKKDLLFVATCLINEVRNISLKDAVNIYTS